MGLGGGKGRGGEVRGRDWRKGARREGVVKLSFKPVFF